jgi:hypothetical protein
MKRIPQFSLWLVLPILLAAGTLHGLSAQIPDHDQNEEYRRFSLSVLGGVTLENDDSGLKLFGSNFNRVTEHSYNIGGGVQYAFTPFWTVGAEYRYTTIDAGALFETDVHSVTLKNYFNFNRLYRRFGISEYLNPFITLGIGRDFFTYKSENITRSGNGIHFNTGFGLAGNISETIEVFAQYDLQMGSNSIDNIRSGFPADLLGMASGGIRIYPGSRNKRRMSMAPPSVTLAGTEYDEFRQRRHEFPEIEEQTSEKESETAILRK